MAINKLPAIAEYWRVDSLIGKTVLEHNDSKPFL